MSGITTYLLGPAAKLRASSAARKASAQAYYSLAEGTGFDYSALLAQQCEQAASPAYEQMEGIVAGVLESTLWGTAAQLKITITE